MQLVVDSVGAPPGLAVGHHRDVFIVFFTPVEVVAGGPVVASRVRHDDLMGLGACQLGDANLGRGDQGGG